MQLNSLAGGRKTCEQQTILLSRDYLIYLQTSYLTFVDKISYTYSCLQTSYLTFVDNLKMDSLIQTPTKPK